MISGKVVRNFRLPLQGYRVAVYPDLVGPTGEHCSVSCNVWVNQAIKRNKAKFPDDFCFRLMREKLAKLRSQFVASNLQHGGNRALPFAFTDQGARMAGMILNSLRAIKMSLEIVRAFVRLCQLFAEYKALSAKIDELDSHVGQHDAALAELVLALRLLAQPPLSKGRPKISFGQFRSFHNYFMPVIKGLHGNPS
jgi:hypothetical protein